MNLVRSRIAICLISAAAGCSPSGPYRTALLGDMPRDLDPVGVNGYAEQTLVSQICGRLTSVDDVQNIEPDMAESWDISPDRKRYVFHLRQGRRFRDGRVADADDVVFSLKRGSQQDKLGQDWGAEVLGIKALSPRDVEIILKEGNPRFLFKLSQPRMCIVNAQGPSYKVAGMSVPDSPGSYQVESRDEGSRQLVLRAARDGLLKPREKRISVYFRAQGEALAMFKRGELDDLSFYLLTPGEIAEAPKDSQVVPLPIYWTWFLHLNPKSKHFNTLEARKRLLSRLDRTALIASWGSPMREGTSVIPYGMRGHSKAAGGLEPATGGRTKIPCQKPLSVVVIRGMPKEAALQDSLSRHLGSIFDCGVNVVFLEMGAFAAAITKGHEDIYVDALDTNSNDPLGFYSYFLDSKLESQYRTPDGRDRLGKEFKRLYALPLEERTQDQYDALLRLFDGVSAGAPLGYPEFKFVYAKAVRTIRMNPLGMHLNRWAEIGR